MGRLTAFSIVLAAAAGLAAAPLRASPQDPPPTLPVAAIPREEAAAIAQYWVLLAEGRFQEAGPAISQLLSRYPRNVSVLALVIEADIGRGGASTALATYDRWLGGRTLEEPGVVRRLARAVLYEWSRQLTDATARSEALEALSQDGDADALAVLQAMARIDDEAGLRMAVHLKQPQAIDRVVARMRATRGLKLRDINLLAQSASALAVPALIDLLKDEQPENRNAAADALGRIGGGAAELALQPVLDDPHGIVRTTAAGALFKLGNFAGINLLTELTGSQNSSIRRSAAILMESRPDESWKSLVRGLLADPDPAIRLDAARMLAPYDPATSRQLLEQLANDNSLAIREETELVITELPVSTLPDLRAIMRVGRPLARVRAAGRVLAMTR